MTHFQVMIKGKDCNVWNGNMDVEKTERNRIKEKYMKRVLNVDRVTPSS